jgi:integrase
VINLSRKTNRNKLTDPEKTAMINKSNLLLKDDFIIYLRSLQRSEGTIVGYENDLLIFFTYIMDNLDNKDFKDITKRDIVRFQNWLISNGNSSARIRRMKAAISSLSNYCENILSDEEPEFDGYRSIVRKIENPPLNTVREKTVWEDSELEGLLDTLVKNKEYDKACMVALGMYGGRRKSELTRFKVSDFDDDKLMCGGALYKSAPILTKGNKYLECYTLAKKFKPYLDLWIDYRKNNNIES